jgi:hypothetical protein
MITVCAMLWNDELAKCRAVYTYGRKHVAALKSMVARHLSLPHEFVCVTNVPGAVDGICRAVPLDMTTFVPGTRYAKLMLFRRDIGERLGERVLYLDLDTVIVDSIDPIVDRPEPLVLWRNPNHVYPRRARYNTSIMLITAGCRPELYESFDPNRHPDEMRKFTTGTDQAWISHNVGADEAYWDASHGIRGAGRPGDIVRGVGETLPPGTRIVFTPGPREPSMPSFQEAHPWSCEHYR